MIKSLLIGASAVAFASAAIAQEPAPEAKPEVAEQADTTPKILDAKQVGTRDEAKLFAENEFEQADLNRDGSVDKDEFFAYATIRAPFKSSKAPESEQPTEETAGVEVPATADEQFAEISKDGETISKTQLAELRVAQFDKADADGDETLDSEERMQFAALTAPKAPQNAL